MTQTANLFQNKILGQNIPNAPKPIIEAIHSASKRSGVDFSYLVNQAKAESSFNPSARAKTSSATGLYQFIDSTWIDMIERYGDDYGLNTDGKSKSEILAMRKDPKAASFMAAAFASENERTLNRNWGGDVGATELYFAHFMGANGASSFLNAKDENPLTPAADLFPRAARANRNVFYNSDTGKPKTLQQVYDFFDKKFQSNNTPALIADNAPVPPEIPNRKLADTRNNTNSLYFDRTAINQDSIIMRRAQAMREGQNHSQDFRSHFGQIPENQTSPFMPLIAKPMEIMFLTQTSPSKVVRDNS